MKQESYQLTPHPIGSLREMWQVSYPLILSFLSGSIMMFCDRMFLANYSLQALNACANAGNVVWLFLVVPMLICGITEVFVGQHHGAGNYKRMGEPTWQMLWFCLMIIPIFVLVATFASPILFYQTGNEVLETEFFSHMLYFGSFMCAYPALCGFFVGKGSVRLITYCTIIDCTLNVILDPLFIFGWGFIPSMGVKGAAIATGLSNVFGVGLLLSVFLRQKYRSRYGTSNWSFRFNTFKECIKVGFPAGIGQLNEVIAHCVFFRLAIMAGGHSITIAALTQSFYISVIFILQGVSKGVITIAANLIGGGQSQLVHKVLLSAVRLICIFAALFSFVLLGGNEALFGMMMSSADQVLLQDPNFTTVLNNTCLFLCLFFLFDGVTQIFAGLLTAAGDTQFLMWIGIVFNWLLYVMPVFVVLYVFELGIDKAWLVLAVCSMSMATAYYWRYRTRNWHALAALST
ncbi:MAG: MATE family efflux transporter [Chlamydiales bacterium]|nr:MATE family efflux transporter [Chlamydiales bacterium]